MKNIKEKELLVNFARALGQEVDESLAKEVSEYNRIKTDAIQNIRESIRTKTNIITEEIFKEPDQPQYPLPPSLDDLNLLIEETKEEIKQIDLQSETVDYISKTIKEESFQQPTIPIPGPDISALQKKLVFLEQWIGKISSAGPGSGETKFKYLDDLEKNSIGDTDQILRYRPSDKDERYGTFFFGQ